jgi:hypothetical protein
MSHRHFGTRDRYAKLGINPHTGNVRQAHPNAATADIGLEEIEVTSVTVTKITRHSNNSTDVRRAWLDGGIKHRVALRHQRRCQLLRPAAMFSSARASHSANRSFRWCSFFRAMTSGGFIRSKQLKLIFSVFLDGKFA